MERFIVTQVIVSLHDNNIDTGTILRVVEAQSNAEALGLFLQQTRDILNHFPGRVVRKHPSVDNINDIGVIKKDFKKEV